MRYPILLGLCFIALLLSGGTCKKQLISSRTDVLACGWVMQSIENAKAYYETHLLPYGLKAGDKVANVGSGSAWEECIWLTFNDSIEFYAQDINSQCLHRKSVDEGLSYYSKLRGSPIKSEIEIVIGTETASKLPTAYFDKILILSTYHEFSEPNSMMSDIYLKLKAGGRLLVKEAVITKEGEIDPVCGLPRKTKAQIVYEISSNGFVFESVIHEAEKVTGKGRYAVYSFLKE